MKSSNMEEKKIIPEVKIPTVILPEAPAGHVVVARLRDGKEVSYFTIPERDYERAYKNNPKYSLKKKETK